MRISTSRPRSVIAVIYSSRVVAADRNASWNTKIASNKNNPLHLAVRTMEDFSGELLFCFVSFLLFLFRAREKWLGDIPTGTGGLLESPGSHLTRRKLNIPAMLMRRTDKAYPLKLWSFRIKVEDGERGTLR
jgi:hypothetical protein